MNEEIQLLLQKSEDTFDDAKFLRDYNRNSAAQIAFTMPCII